MDCSCNEFCSSLTDATREKLCRHCRKRLMKAGSIQIYEDFEREASLLTDGIVLISGYVGEDVMDDGDSVPTCYLGVPGRMLSTNVTFREGGGQEAYGYNGMEYLVDSCVAKFDHDVIRELFDSDDDFAHAMMLSGLRIMEDGCAMTAILRADSVYLGVFHLVRYLTQQSAYLTQRQLANLLNRDRTTVARALSRIREEHPEAWTSYAANKGRKVNLPAR